MEIYSNWKLFYDFSISIKFLMFGLGHTFGPVLNGRSR